jgi:hypothetical protein
MNTLRDVGYAGLSMTLVAAMFWAPMLMHLGILQEWVN